MTVRLGLVGGGWISRHHLEALERLGRTELVGVVAGRRETADAVDRALGRDEPTTTSTGCSTRPHPTSSTWPCRRTGPWPSASAWSQRGIPFLDREAARRRRCATARRGWPTRSTGPASSSPSATTCARSTSWPRSASGSPPRPPRLVVARWLDRTPRPAWWGRVDEGGGQVVEQATHLYDLARLLLGEAVVVGAASTRDPAASPPDGRRRRQQRPRSCASTRGGRLVREQPPARLGRHRGRVRVGRPAHDAREASRTAARATGTPASTTARPSGRSGPRPTRTSSRPRSSSTRSRSPHHPSGRPEHVRRPSSMDRLTRRWSRPPGCPAQRPRARDRVFNARADPASRWSTSSIRLPKGSRT